MLFVFAEDIRTGIALEPFFKTMPFVFTTIGSTGF